MPDPYTETLTPAGERWALTHGNDSQVARVALQGERCGWPATHVAMAIRVCNHEGRNAPDPNRYLKAAAAGLGDLPIGGH